MGFKIGDRVKIHACEGAHRYNGKIGRVVRTGRIKQGLSTLWDYECEFENDYAYPFRPEEMEKITVKGQQLEFKFMDE